MTTQDQGRRDEAVKHTLRGGPLDGGSVHGAHHALLLFAADVASHLWLTDPEPLDPPAGASFYLYERCSGGHYHYSEVLSAYAVLEALGRRLIEMDTVLHAPDAPAGHPDGYGAPRRPRHHPDDVYDRTADEADQ